MELELKKITLTLKVPWRLSRGESLVKENFVVTLKDEGLIAQSEVAPNRRYGETVEIIEGQFVQFQQASGSFLEKLDRLALRPALRFALESAYLNLQAQEKNISLSDLLALPATDSGIETFFSIPIMPIEEIKDYLASLNRFKRLKIKVNKECATAMACEVHRLRPDALLCVDGNEAWECVESYQEFERSVAHIPLAFVEEPFPSHRKDLYQKLYPHSRFCLMADESILAEDNLDELKTMFHAVNIKLMKTGSLIKARDLLVRARSLGFKTMMGCMIETGLGISYALHFASLLDWADLDGFLLIADNPFPLVQEREGVISFKE
jgi:L-Ala-D/L-Glu epimerase